MAQQFVQTKITGDKVVVFLKPTCPYCVMAQRVFSEYKFKPGHLECVDISGLSDMDKIQDYLMELTGARSVSAPLSVFTMWESSPGMAISMCLGLIL